MNRWVAARLSICCVALATLLCLSLIGCATTASGSASHSASPTPSSAAFGPVATVTLACTIHSAAGAEDDQTQQTLTCTVGNAPRMDTQFTLHYSLREPAGSLYPLAKTCDGALHAGSGTCVASYAFIVPFSAVPGPVSGESLPSHHALGPVTPQT